MDGENEKDFAEIAPGEDRTRDLSLTKRTHYHYATEALTMGLEIMRNSLIAARSWVVFRYSGFRRICCPLSPFSDAHRFPVPASPRPHFLQTFNRCISPHTKCGFDSVASFRYVHATAVSFADESRRDMAGYDSNGEVEPIEGWEEEDEAEPVVGDGGDGGGVVLHNCPWGERALSVAKQVLVEFGEGMELYAFKTSPRGYVYVRLDKLSNPYGCPSMEEIEQFSRQYKQKLDEISAKGEIPDDLALEVSSPGADRLLRVPDDLLRFKDMPMVVSYSEDSHTRSLDKTGVYFLDSIKAESRCCIWKLADVRENRDPAAKGRPLNRKQKDARLRVPYDMIHQATLYLSY